MTREILNAKINTILDEFLKQKGIQEPPKEEDSLEDLGLTSIDFVDLIFTLQSYFNVEFTDEDLIISNFLTLKNIGSVVEIYIEG